LKLAAELMVSASTAMDDVVEQYHEYRKRVNSSGWNASPVRLHLAIGRLIQQNGAIESSHLGRAFLGTASNTLEAEGIEPGV
jgi:hypothetical protein